MDSNRFDRISRVIGEQADRRAMIKAAAGSALAIIGLGGVSRTVLGADVTAEANKGYRGDDCSDNPNICKKGLRCNDNNKCEYKHKCGSKRRGKPGDACKKRKDCCSRGGTQQVCRNKRCRRR